MLQDGVKADIEALQSVEGAVDLPEMVLTAIEEGDALA